MRSTCRHSAVSGVRSSCEIMPRKRVLSWLVRWAWSRAAIAAAVAASARVTAVTSSNDCTTNAMSPPSDTTGVVVTVHRQGSLPSPRRPPFDRDVARISTDMESGACDDSARSRAPRRRAARSDVPAAPGAAKSSHRSRPSTSSAESAVARRNARFAAAAVSSGTLSARHGARVASKSALKSGADRSPFLRSRKAHLSDPPPSDSRLTFLQTRPDCQGIKRTARRSGDS